MNKLFLFLTLIFIQTKAHSQGMWMIDVANSQVMFTATHLSITEVSGVFRTFSGSVTSTKKDFTDANVKITIETNSFYTSNDLRDEEIKGEAMLNTGKFPTMVFIGKGLKKTSGNNYTLTGDLTIKDVTKPITLEVTYFGTIRDNWGNNKAGFKITGKLNRFDYNISQDTETKAGVKLVSADVVISCNLEMVQPGGREIK